MILKNKIKKIIEAIKDTDINSIEISSFWGAQKIKLSKSNIVSDTNDTQEVQQQSSDIQEKNDINIILDEESDKAEADNTIPEKNKIDDNSLTIIKAPLIGTYYESSKPGEPPFIQVGDTISKGQTLCIIEAMKIFNEIESEYDGTIIEVLNKDSDPVEFDQPLFKLKE